MSNVFDSMGDTCLDKAPESKDNKVDESVLLNIYETFTPESIVDGLEESTSLEDYGNIQKEIENRINKIFEEYLQNYSDVVKNTINKRSLMGFNGTEEEKIQAMHLIYQKNRLYYACVLKYIEDGGLDEILDGKDKQDILSFLKARLGKIFDTIFINWYKEGKKYISDTPNGLHYGGITEKGIVPYGNFQKDSFGNLGFLHNNLLKEYVTGIKTLVSTTAKQKDWEINMEKEPQLWRDKNSKLGFVGPQEKYMLVKEKGKAELVEPHIALFIKQSFTKEKEYFSALYQVNFGQNYNVADIASYFVEPIFESGSIGFRKIAGESIPNPDAISKKYGKVNLIIPSRTRSRMKEGLEKMKNILLVDIDNEQFEKIVKVSSDFVIAHELGHSLFLQGDDYKNELEELKADLSYFLKLSDYLDWEEKLDIEAIFQQFVINTIRRFQNINIETNEINPDMKEYVIASVVKLKQAFEMGFIKFKGEKLVYNKEKFQAFVEKMINLLIEIKEIYDEQSGEKEQGFKDKYYDLGDENVVKFILKAN